MSSQEEKQDSVLKTLSQWKRPSETEIARALGSDAVEAFNYAFDVLGGKKA